MISALSKRLSPKGSFVSLDPTYIENQNFIAKMMNDLDSGQNIRTQPAYAKLFPSFGYDFDSQELSGLLNIPYNHCLNILTPN